MIGGLQPAPPQYGENITSEGYKVVIALCSFQPSRLNQLAFDKYDKLVSSSIILLICVQQTNRTPSFPFFL